MSEHETGLYTGPPTVDPTPALREEIADLRAKLEKAEHERDIARHDWALQANEQIPVQQQRDQAEARVRRLEMDVLGLRAVLDGCPVNWLEDEREWLEARRAVLTLTKENPPSVSEGT